MFKGIKEFFTNLGDTFNLNSVVSKQEETVIEYMEYNQSSGSTEVATIRDYKDNNTTEHLETQKDYHSIVQKEVNTTLGKIVSPLPQGDRLISIIQQYFEEFFVYHCTETLKYQNMILGQNMVLEKDIIVSQTARETIQEVIERHTSSLEYGVFKANLLVESRLKELEEEEKQEKEFLAKEMRKNQEDFIENILKDC